jgi:NAD(P)-dependent dehydrogenase (short-subunit alcohol dehydrogenase family)
MEIAGASALVTGANRGIGAATVTALLAAGAARVYAAMRAPDETSVSAPNVVTIRLDVTDPEQVAQAAHLCGDVQILVNNAGIGLFQPLIAAHDPCAAEQEMRVNYLGPLAMCRAFAPILGRNGGGAIVNVLSILARVAVPVAGSYSASKAAAYLLTQAIRGELAAQGTLVVGVMPGYVNTDMVRGLDVPKLDASEVALSIVRAIRSDFEDVYPGSAAHVAAALLQDPKSVEKQFASVVPASRNSSTDHFAVRRES